MNFAGVYADGCTPGRISTERGFTMIATHNIKADGRWYAAGEVVPDQQITMAVVENGAEPEVAAEEKKAEPKPKTAANRRKASK